MAIGRKVMDDFIRFLSGLMLILMMFMVSCASDGSSGQRVTRKAGQVEDAAKASPPMKSFNSAEEYLKEAVVQSKAGKHSECLAYLREALKLNPNNPEAHALAGVTYAKLGKGSPAREEFEKAVRIDASSAEADNAREWLKRFENPVRVVLYQPITEPKLIFKQSDGRVLDPNRLTAPSDKRIHEWEKKNVNRQLSNFMSGFLNDCGLYKLSQFYGKGSSSADVCRQLNKGENDILIVPTKIIITLQEHLDNVAARVAALPLLILAPFTGAVAEAVSTPSTDKAQRAVQSIGFTTIITSNICIDVVHIKECKLIKQIEREGSPQEIPSDALDTQLGPIFDNTFREIALEVHDTLL